MKPVSNIYRKKNANNQQWILTGTKIPLLNSPRGLHSYITLLITPEYDAIYAAF